MEEINTYLSDQQQLNQEFNVESLIKFIYSKMPRKSTHLRIHYKKYPEDNLVQIYTESAREYTKWPIYNICRSAVFDQKNNKLLSYSHPNLEYLEYSPSLELSLEQNFTESHEGTLISVFYHNNKWYYATRRNLDMYVSTQEKSHGLMFEDALSKLGLTKDNFEQMLNTNYKYNFELVHYQNKYNISYESQYGDNYAKIFLLFTRDENQTTIIPEPDNMKIFINNIIDRETVIKNMEDSTLVMEGYIFTQNNHLCKLMHPNYYNIVKYNPGYKTVQEKYIYLYQKNLLVEYLDKINNKVYKVSETGDSIEVVGMVSCIFTYIGQRLLDIYYTFNNNNMVHRNEVKFKELFENKKYYLIFHTLGMMKGIHKNKQLNIIEMRTLLKYKIEPTDMWKLFNELVSFEETENLLSKWANPLVKMFV